ncbi:hypothetical protein [Zavarzinia sp. CC-PAN008]|uniref:hypothetical protein n=1 Tax=Zavarzinia sp. CC-PAN008 TaxID=3243332 RepID=UPI003F74210D
MLKRVVALMGLVLLTGCETLNDMGADLGLSGGSAGSQAAAAPPAAEAPPPAPDPGPVAAATPSTPAVPSTPGLTARITAPLELAAGSTSVALEATITNDTGSATTVTAATPCDVHRWRILDSAGQEIARQPEQMCAQVVESLPLEAGETRGEPFTIDVPAGALAAGQTYRIDYRFWGVPAEAAIGVR